MVGKRLSVFYFLFLFHCMGLSACLTETTDALCDFDPNQDICLCGQICTSPTPYCDGESKSCVACIVGENHCEVGLVCDGESHTCEEVVCARDADCAGETSVCDPTMSRCVERECLRDENCTDGKVCDTEASFQCVECVPQNGVGQDGRGCEASEVCDPRSRTCVECVSHADCDADPALGKCDPVTLSCVACSEDVHCTEAEAPQCVEGICSPCDVDAVGDNGCESLEGLGVCKAGEGAAPNVCVQCTESSQCEDGERDVCNEATNECVVCLPGANPTGCEGDLLCDGESGSCEACLVDDVDGQDPGCDAGSPACRASDRECVECTAEETSRCDVAGQVCDVGDNACVECLSNGDCQDAGRSKCDEATHSCVACEEDNDCGSELPRCEAGVCAACEVGGNPNGCEHVEGRGLCKDRAPDESVCVECLDDGDCNPGVCDADVCVECADNGDCGGLEPVCDVDNHVCVAGCVADAGCAAGFVCEGQVCVAGCRADKPCPEGEVCDGDPGLCVECIEDGDCADVVGRRICDEERNVCVAGCVDAGEDCTDPDFPQCDVATNACVECTAENPDCPQTAQDEGRSVCDTGNKVCVGCLEDSDCNDALHVNVRCGADRTCQPCDAQLGNIHCLELGASVCDGDMGKCVACDSNADTGCEHLPETSHCAAFGGETRCVECTADANCAAPTPACDNNVCVECREDAQCWDEGDPDGSNTTLPVCGFGNACVQCVIGDHCAAGRFCIDGQCQCGNDGECNDGLTCVGGFCQ